MTLQKKGGQIWILLCILSFLAAMSAVAMATPTGSTIHQFKNETNGISAPVMLNESTGGGYIYTINISGSIQDQRWKAYVGNVTGKWVLADVDGNAIYDWPLTSLIQGEIYVTRKAETVQWTNINCTYSGAGVNTSAPNSDITNRIIEEQENQALAFTNPDDNVTATFNVRNHSQMMVGNRIIPANTCYSTFTYVNNTKQTQSTLFQELLLYDGLNNSVGSVVYATFVEDNANGFDSGQYDFQLIVPNNGTSQTIVVPYYFYVELG